MFIRNLSVVFRMIRVHIYAYMYNGSLNFLFLQDIEVDIKVETGKSEGRREKIFNSGMHPGSLARAYGRRLENFHACSR